MKIKTLSVLFLLFLLTSAQLLAFDNQRKGFILGAGFGTGFLSNKFARMTLNKFAIATNFIVGYAPTNNLEIYYLNTVSWWGDDNVTLVTGLTGIGVTKYFNPEGIGFYISGGVGLSVHYAPFEVGKASYGLGVLGGIGYDLSRHWGLQGDVIYIDIKDGFIIKSLGFRVTLNVLAY